MPAQSGITKEEVWQHKHATMSSFACSVLQSFC